MSIEVESVFKGDFVGGFLFFSSVAYEFEPVPC